MSFHPFARATSNHRPKLFLGTVCAVLLASMAAEAKEYKGAEVLSRKTWLYGRIELRMRMIRGSSLLSTFFTYKNGSETAGTAWGEIDIEVFGKDDAVAWQSNIISSFPKDYSVEIHTNEKSLADEYHTWTIEWAPDYIQWLFDGKEVRKTEGGQAKDLTEAQSLRFNVWSSETASWAGEFDESALPAYQFVNWIKFYRYDNGKYVLDWIDDFDKFDESRWATGTWSFGGNRVDFDPENVVVKDGTLVLAITKEGETGFSGSVPVDPQGNAGPMPTPSTGGTGGSSSSSSSGSSKDPDFKSSGGCSYGSGAGGAWAAMILLGLALLGLRTNRSRKR